VILSADGLISDIETGTLAALMFERREKFRHSRFEQVRDIPARSLCSLRGL